MLTLSVYIEIQPPRFLRFHNKNVIHWQMLEPRSWPVPELPGLLRMRPSRRSCDDWSSRSRWRDTKDPEVEMIFDALKKNQMSWILMPSLGCLILIFHAGYTFQACYTSLHIRTQISNGLSWFSVATRMVYEDHF